MVKYVKLIDLIAYRDELNTKADFIPALTNYLIETSLHNGKIEREIAESYSTFYPSKTNIKDHLTIINPNSNCYVGLTDNQLKML
jgi:hypothetical protein